jgi:hypothetical protein
MLLNGVVISQSVGSERFQGVSGAGRCATAVATMCTEVFTSVRKPHNVVGTDFYRLEKTSWKIEGLAVKRHIPTVIFQPPRTTSS